MPLAVQIILAIVGVASAAFATGFIAGRLFERWQWSIFHKKDPGK